MPEAPPHPGSPASPRRSGSRAQPRPSVAANAILRVAALALAGTVASVRADDAPSPPPGDPAPVTFVAYNLKNYLRMDRRIDGEFVEDAPKPESEIVPLVRLLAATRPDVLGVCEIGGMEEVGDLQRRLRDEGIDLPHVEWVDASDKARHLALLSRFPIAARASQTDLVYRIDTQTLPFQRGILDATIEVNPAYRVRLLGLHLKSKREIPEADQALMRRNEAHLLRLHIDAILEADPTTNLLVYGDMNDTRNESPIQAIQGRFGSDRYLRDIQLADELGYRWTYYWRFADQYSRFDFVFANRALVPEILADRSLIASHPDWFAASDHRPLVVRISPVNRETP